MSEYISQLETHWRTIQLGKERGSYRSSEFDQA
jgi:hypothetical protein